MLRRHLSEMMNKINKRLRAKISREETEIIHRKFARGGQALLGGGANFRAELRRQRINRHGATHFPRALSPSGFALEGLRYAKRVYEKTARRRACDGSQELHNAERPAAPQR